MENDSNILYTIIDHAHSGLRWVVIVLLIAAILRAFSKRRGGSLYPGKDQVALFAFVSTHIQLLLGLILYFFLSPYVRFEGGMSAIMGDTVTRFYTVEHFVGMLLAIGLITFGYLRAKRQAELNKGWRTIGVYYLIGLIIILVSIPWPFRNLGAGWF
ncbi:MAG: cytochrome B [Bacteroidota bacterium]